MDVYSLWVCVQQSLAKGRNGRIYFFRGFIYREDLFSDFFLYLSLTPVEGWNKTVCVPSISTTHLVPRSCSVTDRKDLQRSHWNQDVNLQRSTDQSSLNRCLCQSAMNISANKNVQVRKSKEQCFSTSSVEWPDSDSHLNFVCWRHNQTLIYPKRTKKLLTVFQ